MPKKKLKINRIDFEAVFELSDEEVAYLDTETGETVYSVTDAEAMIEDFLSEDQTLEEALASLEADDTLSVTDKLLLQGLLKVELCDDPDRYRMLPKSDSREGYRDMQEYIWSLKDEHLAELLEEAIQGSGAFKRFKAVLHRNSKAEENWFNFRDQREQERMMEWFDSEDIEPEFI